MQLDPGTIAAIVLVVTTISVLLAAISDSRKALARRIDQVERKLDLLLDKMEIPRQEAGEEEIRGLLAAGRKIEAIKLYRERTGVGLKEAKDAVESMDG